MRNNVQNALDSRIPKSLNLCDANIQEVCSYINEATDRLLKDKAAGDNGWWGCWDKLVLTATRENPYLTVPSKYARLMGINVCNMPQRIQNEFYEMLEAGVGIKPSCAPANNCLFDTGAKEVFDRNMFPTLRDIDATNQKVRFYITNSADVGSRILVQGLDQNGLPITSLDGVNQILGEYITLDSPFATSIDQFSKITGIQKQLTSGDVVMNQVDQTTGVEVLLSRFAFTDTTPTYRRYYLNRLPCTCACTPTDTNIKLTVLAKLEYYPVRLPSDWLMIGNLAALKEECLAIRYGEMDSTASVGLAKIHHMEAVKLLKGELDHYLGVVQPAVNFKPFGTATLDRQCIGSLI